METLKKIINLECLGAEDSAFYLALKAPHDSFCLCQEYKNFTDDLDNLLNKNFIL